MDKAPLVAKLVVLAVMPAANAAHFKRATINKRKGVRRVNMQVLLHAPRSARSSRAEDTARTGPPNSLDAA